MFKIRIPSTGQIYQIDIPDKIKPCQGFLVEAEQIIERAVLLDTKIDKNEELPLANFQRLMSEDDFIHQKELKEKAKGYLEEAQSKIIRHNLNMKILDADLSYDEKKLTFYFCAEGRIDFRSLVADMVGSFRKIIRLQQIGPRQEARLFGGFGRCGRELCCWRFLANNDKISADMAAIQEIGGAKLSKMTGCCGRLMCCLSYEMEGVKDIKKEAEKNK